MATPQALTATIANGASLSGAVAINFVASQPLVLQMPAAWTTADLTFQVSSDGTNYYELFTIASGASTVYTITSPLINQWIVLDPKVFIGAAFFKVRSGTLGSAVNQGAARTISFLAV